MPTALTQNITQTETGIKVDISGKITEFTGDAIGMSNPKTNIIKLEQEGTVCTLNTSSVLNTFDIDDNLMEWQGEAASAIMEKIRSFFPNVGSDTPTPIAATIARDDFNFNISYPGFAQDDNGTIFKQGAYYLITGITNPFNSRVDVILQCVETTQAGEWAKFAIEGKAAFLNADFQGIGDYSALGNPIKNGIWRAADEGAYVGDSVVIWNNNHYTVTSPIALNGNSPDNNNDGYVLRSKSEINFGHILEWDKIIYDFANDSILWRMDKRNNKINNSSLATWDWGNDGSHDFVQENANVSASALNNRGVISGKMNGISGELHIDNNGPEFIFVDVENSSIIGDNNSNQVKIYAKDSTVLFNNNSGVITGKFEDGANWNFDSNTEDWMNMDATNGGQGFIAFPDGLGGKGGDKSKYLRNELLGDWQDIKVANNLPKGQFVFIYNEAPGETGTDLGIRIFCETKNKFALQASGGFLNPDYQGVGDYSGAENVSGVGDLGITRGVWQSANEGDYGLGDIVIWSGLHYQVISVVDFPVGPTPPPDSTGNYTLLPKSAPNVGYIEEWDAIEYDFDNNWIQSREDKRGNKVKCAFTINDEILGYNPLALFQWGNYKVQGNSVNESLLSCINNTNEVRLNDVSGGAFVFCEGNLNVFTENIINNSTITQNENPFSISNCTFFRVAADFTNATKDYDSKALSPYLSTFDAIISCDTNLVANVLNVPDYLGIIYLDSTNASETIKEFSTHPTFERTFSTVGDSETFSTVVFNNTGTPGMIFPSPSTSATIKIGGSDFIKLLLAPVGGNVLIQTASEQY